MMVEWRKIALGLRFDDRKKRFKFVGVRPWYAKQHFDSPGSAAADEPGTSLEIYSLEALQGVAFEGTAVQSVELEAGDAEAEPPPGREIVPDRIVVGDLDGDARPEAALLLRDPSGGALYLAVAGEESGQPVSRALFPLHESESPAKMAIAEQVLQLAWTVPLPDAATATSATPSESVAPPSERRRRFRLSGTELVELPEPESALPTVP
jgi:hypothetical protein